MNLILASASPRRKQLLEQIGLNFSVLASSVEETIPQNQPPVTIAEDLAWAKAKDIATQVSDGIVIGADTIVVKDEEILGKPESLQVAKDMLMKLSSSVHKVITGLAVIDVQRGISFKTHEVTNVYFKQLSEEEIDNYVASGEPMDKAGAYAIQGKAAVFVQRIEGCYFNVVGLPLSRLADLLKEISLN